MERVHHVNRINDNWLAKIAKNGKPSISKALWTASKTLVRKLDLDITEEQACWIKCRTRSYKTKKRKKIF